MLPPNKCSQINHSTMVIFCYLASWPSVLGICTGGSPWNAKCPCMVRGRNSLKTLRQWFKRGLNNKDILQLGNWVWQSSSPRELNGDWDAFSIVLCLHFLCHPCIPTMSFKSIIKCLSQIFSHAFCSRQPHLRLVTVWTLQYVGWGEVVCINFLTKCTLPVASKYCLVPVLKRPSFSTPIFNKYCYHRRLHFMKSVCVGQTTAPPGVFMISVLKPAGWNWKMTPHCMGG